MTTEVKQSDVERLMSRSLLDVFNERDSGARSEAIAEVYSHSVRFFEQDEVVNGRTALARKVQALLDGTPPDWVFTPVGEVSVNHDLGRLRWALGPPGGAQAVTGTDVALVSGDQISSLYVFVDPR